MPHSLVHHGRDWEGLRALSLWRVVLRVADRGQNLGGGVSVGVKRRGTGRRRI